MTAASVGFQCPECIKASAKTAPVYTARSLQAAFQPYATYALMALNIGVFVWGLATGSNIMTGRGGTPFLYGTEYGPLVHEGDWWRLFTNGFVHFGIIHLGMNMLVLYLIGPQVERLLGVPRFLGLYFAALFAGSLGAMLVTPQAVGAGASGAIFGLLGAAAAYQYSQKINMWQSGLARLILLNLFITFAVPGISIGAHVGGLVGGTLAGFAIFELEKREQSQWVGVGVSVAISIACLYAAILVSPAFAVP